MDTTEEVEEWVPWRLVSEAENPHVLPPVLVKPVPGPPWDIEQVLKAARLLHKPPDKVQFVDEQEMRRVYSLIYDVFRYKIVLDQALQDVDFFGENPKLLEQQHVCWLFLLELARRRWASRAGRAAAALRRAGPPYAAAEAALWRLRVRLAAAIAKIRIRNKALSLSDLLPPHLREERVSVCAYKETVTGWVNTFKAKKVAALIERLHDLGYTYSSSKQLCAGEYRFDRVCPRFITLRPPENESIGQLDLVREGIIVLQEREFCEGASTLCRALRRAELRGAVAQTHASSPRSSAYLAAQLAELAAAAAAPSAPARRTPTTPHLGKLIVFGAGDKAESYIEALRSLGVPAGEGEAGGGGVRVVREAVHGAASALAGVVAALATPPNSYSAVADPIDLVCGRGGDIALLETLTEAELDGNGKARVQSILEEQRKTLKTLLSKPQIQMVVYETHSALSAENATQVTRAVDEANRLARDRHKLIRARHEKCLKSKENSENVADPTNLDKARPDLEGVDSSKDHNNENVSNATPQKKARAQTSSDPVLRKQTSLVETRTRLNKSRPIPDNQVTIDETNMEQEDDVTVPDCDLFEIQPLPSLGNGLDINYILDRDGCYLGLIQRKEVTRMDAMYMIQVAEERGLFGTSAPPAPPRRRRADPAPRSPRRRRRKSSFELCRVAAPTYASLWRSRRDSAPAAGAGCAVCPTHARRHALAALGACVCDYKHRRVEATPNRVEGAPCDAASSPAPPCRRPLHLPVHYLQLEQCTPTGHLACQPLPPNGSLAAVI